MLGVREAQGPLNHRGSHALCAVPLGEGCPRPCPCIPIVGPIILSLVAGGKITL